MAAANNEFFEALSMLEHERGITAEYLIEKIKAAIVIAVKKNEPTSALDPELTGEVLSVMRKLAEEGMTMLVVTHEMGFARNVSSKTVFMENGVVVEQAPSHEFFAHPREERTREFLRKIEHTA